MGGDGIKDVTYSGIAMKSFQFYDHSSNGAIAVRDNDGNFYFLVRCSEKCKKMIDTSILMQHTLSHT